MSVSEIPKKPPPPHPLIVALLVLILAGVLYTIFLLNSNLKNIGQVNRGDDVPAAQQTR